MRRIKNVKWKENTPIKKEGTDEIEKYEEREVDLVSALGSLIQYVNGIPRDQVKTFIEEGRMTKEQKEELDKLPKGFEGAIFQNALTTAFNNARKNGRLIIEESDYVRLREMVDVFTPEAWGSNPDIFGAIKLFMDAKKV